MENLGARNEVETATFLLSQHDVPQPDATIKCGAYSWRVHSRRFCEVSPFFRAAFDGCFQESASRTLELHHDNPWMIARTIQYVYRGHFENQQSDSVVTVERYTVTLAMHLSDIMAGQQVVEGFEADLKRDAQQSCPQRAFGVYNIAEQYQIPELQKLAVDDAIPDSLITAPLQASTASTDKTSIPDQSIVHITDALDIVGTFRLAKDKYFRRKLAMLAVVTPEARKHKRIVDWCMEEPDFGLLMMDCMAEVFTKREQESRSHGYPPSKRRRY